MTKLQPFLAGSLVSIRPLNIDDFAALFAVASDPLIWEQHPARDRYQEPVFRKYFDEAIASGGGLAILDRESDEVIGTSRFVPYLSTPNTLEIGWTFLARKCWGGRYNSEVKALMLEHAFTFADAVVFRVNVNNLRSQHAVLKLGALREISPSSTDPNTVVFRLTRNSISFSPASAADMEELVAIRIEAMRESLEQVGRFDPNRARERLVSGFSAEHTQIILANNERIGFYALKPIDGGLLLDHLYIRPPFQSKAFGAAVLARIFAQADESNLPIRVGALKGSRANQFYTRHGFVLIEQGEFDNYYTRSSN